MSTRSPFPVFQKSWHNFASYNKWIYSGIGLQTIRRLLQRLEMKPEEISELLVKSCAIAENPELSVLGAYKTKYSGARQRAIIGHSEPWNSCIHAVIRYNMSNVYCSSILIVAGIALNPKFDRIAVSL